MSVFTDKNPPEQLAPSDFKDFALHMMSGFFVDLTQPGHWTHVAGPTGRSCPRIYIGRKVAPKLTALGGTLTPNLLRRIITTFCLYGPEISDELNYANNPPAPVAGAVQE